MTRRIIDNFGRPEGKHGPISAPLCTHSSPDGEVEVVIRLYPLVNAAAETCSGPEDTHWDISWVLVEGPAPMLRRIHAVSEWRDDSMGRRDHLTNWGPLSQIVREATFKASRAICLGLLSREQRLLLEHIASDHPITDPASVSGGWDCADFVAEVLYRAVDCKLFSRDTVDAALADARRVVRP
ncbi:hypothetical protein OE88DRAFT_1654451 [Heliocybe sulcata]|uniref:Uncharacterized protein n=1 Tax=Heliocybe sulcata TaxID=5364 RepID=A0A5C3N9I5_9AGAM|nr:hypothetical protein OE88DRAFT_1654451 [Heliocybe sulcata]